MILGQGKWCWLGRGGWCKEGLGHCGWVWLTWIGVFGQGGFVCGGLWGWFKEDRWWGGCCRCCCGGGGSCCWCGGGANNGVGEWLIIFFISVIAIGIWAIVDKSIIAQDGIGIVRCGYGFCTWARDNNIIQEWGLLTVQNWLGDSQQGVDQGWIVLLLLLLLMMMLLLMTMIVSLCSSWEWIRVVITTKIEVDSGRINTKCPQKGLCWEQPISTTLVHLMFWPPSQIVRLKMDSAIGMMMVAL